jgi:hypothetical protein
MNTLDRVLARIPLFFLTVVAAWLAVAPIHPQPHLIEKWTMLSHGTLTRPIDIFDLFLHTTPLVVLALKLWRTWAQRGASPRSPEAADTSPPPPPQPPKQP